MGKYLVSTVGEYLPDASLREILAETRGVILTGKGEVREADYLEKIGFEEVGASRKFETMVFLAGNRCKCGCGLPEHNGTELDFKGYNETKDAAKGHMTMCERWSHKDV